MADAPTPRTSGSTPARDIGPAPPPPIQLRITRYDPALRNSSGTYTREVWTSFQHIGRRIGGALVTAAEVQRVEDAHVAVAEACLREAGVGPLTVRGLENPGRLALGFGNGSRLEPDQQGAVLRRLLREEFWCRLEGERAFVHVGWDYYLFLGVPRPAPAAGRLAQRLGLFVEPCASPFLEDAAHDP